MSKSPLITIGLTCYNAQDTIARAIGSALDQTYSNTEILVVDDVSTDGSIDIIKSFKGVCLIEHKTNTGAGGARQTLLDNAKGQYLAFFDDDDISAPARIEKQLEAIQKAEQDYKTDRIACYASGEKDYQNGYKAPIKAIGRHKPHPRGEAVAAHILYFDQTHKDLCFGAAPSCTLMAAVQTFKDAGGFDPNQRRVEDLDFVIRLSLLNGVFIGTSENLVTQTASQGNDKSHEANMLAEQNLAQKYRTFLESKNRYHYALNWPKLRYAHFKKDYILFAKQLLILLRYNPISTIKQLCITGPARILHEYKMQKRQHQT